MAVREIIKFPDKRLRLVSEPVKRLAESMRHVEAVIPLFDPAYDTRRMSVRRRYMSNLWFRRGRIALGGL
jgi:hypothetical protein